MMSRHFRLSSELSGAIAKRLPHAKNQSRPKFHNIEPVYSGHLLNAASGHPFVVPY